jgi:hypothetical protein
MRANAPLFPTGVASQLPRGQSPLPARARQFTGHIRLIPAGRKGPVRLSKMAACNPMSAIAIAVIDNASNNGKNRPRAINHLERGRCRGPTITAQVFLAKVTSRLPCYDRGRKRKGRGSPGLRCFTLRVHPASGEALRSIW